jgi:hypothetical protein
MSVGIMIKNISMWKLTMMRERFSYMHRQLHAQNRIGFYLAAEYFHAEINGDD